MKSIDAASIRACLPWDELIEALAVAVRRNRVSSPPRQSLAVPVPGHADATLLMMPAWEPGSAIGVKAVTYFPSNGGTLIPTINAGYLLFDGSDGRLIAVLDGDELTTRRTAAASALASRHLSRHDSRVLLVAGTGQLAVDVAEAHASVRSFDRILIWGRRADRAQVVVDQLLARELPAERAPTLAEAVSGADVISCVTAATEPFLEGDRLTPGTHVDLIGSFGPAMREADDSVVRRATIAVDTRAGALQAGDLAQPLAAGVIHDADIQADLADLVTGAHPGRRSADEITLYKSAGFALEDLVAARLAFERHVDE